MEPTKHLNQGITLLNRVISFAEMMKGRPGTDPTRPAVHLFEQDWFVLLDFIQNPDATSFVPESVRSLRAEPAAMKLVVEMTDGTEIQVEKN